MILSNTEPAFTCSQLTAETREQCAKSVFKVRSSHPEVFLEISQISQQNICASVSFLIKLQTSACNFNFKSYSGTGVFLWILRSHWRRSVAFIVNFEQIQIFFRCCCCWLWTSICRLGITYRPHFADTIDFDLQICWGLTYS